jgi:SPP1 family predicted phage head-tail adaptor
VFQKKVESRGPAGGVSHTWETQFTAPCGIEPLSGKEFLAIQQTQGEVSVRIVLRYHTDIDDTWRVVNDGKAYAIHAALNENERDRMLTLMCSTGVKDTGDLPEEGEMTFEIIKDPQSVLEYTIDWAPTMAESSPSDTISESSWAADNGMTVDSNSNTTNTTTVWVSGGTAMRYALLVNTIVTGVPRTHERTIVVKLQNR